MKKKAAKDSEPKAPQPKFNTNTFIWRNKNGERDFVYINDLRTYEPSRGWIYGIDYTQGVDLHATEAPVWTAGGSSFWHDESNFEPLDPVKDAVLILRVRLREETAVQEKLNEQLQDSKSRESAIRTSLSLLNP